MPQFGRTEIQLPVLCEPPFIEMLRHLVWITCCLLTWVRTTRPSGKTLVAHFVANSVLISERHLWLTPHFLTSEGLLRAFLALYQTRLFWTGQVSYVSSATSRKAVPTDWSGSSTGRGFLVSLAGWMRSRCAFPHFVSFLLYQLRAPDLGIRRAASVGTTQRRHPYYKRQEMTVWIC